ncbi:hypothetical protein TOPH_05449 [Tolypocladium ophioglossoides CBS 100239]|uniref:Uncharacterized protein n=1 Tax=Tolypocladium ophioglossoides (strain CBS 100239) TaxID=1163406 RepID=A0A0L0N6V4_TOLOC|nr:hypothetical protein TOPH_05449 [Tolypocladium ophioglossoides CBS 100239]
MRTDPLSRGCQVGRTCLTVWPALDQGSNFDNYSVPLRTRLSVKT